MHDVSNPIVFRNYTINLMKEGKGKFEEKTVLVFTDINGIEYICPKEVVEYRLKLNEDKNPVKKAGRPKKDEIK